MSLPLLLLLGAGAAAAVAAASSSSSSSPSSKTKTDEGPMSATPPPLNTAGDLGGYLKRLQDEQDAIAAQKAATEADSAARVDQIKSIAKYIPILGTSWTSLVDLAAWLGSVLGSNYREENRAEDLQALSDEVAAYLRAGWVPPNPEFHLSGKVGARSFAEELAIARAAAENLSNRRSSGYLFDDGGISTAAMRTIGALTLKWAADPRLAPALEALGGDQGILFTSTAFPPPRGQLVIPMFLGALVALETGDDIVRMQTAAVAAWKAEEAALTVHAAVNPNAFPTPSGEVAPFPPTGDAHVRLAALDVDVFLRVLREAGNPKLDLRVSVPR